MLSFERYSLKFLDKILQERHQDSSSGTAPPPSCLPSRLPDVTHVTLSPGLPPPFLHTASDQKLEAGTAWERGCTVVDALILIHSEFNPHSEMQDSLVVNVFPKLFEHLQNRIELNCNSEPSRGKALAVSIHEQGTNNSSIHLFFATGI